MGHATERKVTTVTERWDDEKQEWVNDTRVTSTTTEVEE